MAPEILSQGLTRVREHVVNHAMERVSLVLHGGEPLLVGASFIADFATRSRAVLGDVTNLRFTIQSNGTLLTREILDVLTEHDIVIGISLDGDRRANDRHRVDKVGNSSYDRVVDALTLLREPAYRGRLSGLLCTISLESDPIEVYEGLIEMDPPWIDLLLPHGTWDVPPPGKADPMAGTPYADWLIAVFDRWFHAPVKKVRIRIFEEIMSLLMGGHSAYEAFGLGKVSLIVVETDGTLEQVDSLKAAYDGAAETGLDIFANSFDDALLAPPVVARQIGIDGLCRTCRECDLVDVCGGGLYSHRYRTGSGMLNPSVYCADLTALIRHVRRTLESALAERGR
jgi:uncharacterized protein